MTPFTEHNIYFGDSRKLSKITDESVQLIVTSPPYWQHKDYGTENHSGYNDSYEDYINNLNLVWTECYRVLSDGCRMCVNIGYQFARSAYFGRYKVIPIRDEIIRYCETAGFDYMGAVIWQTTQNPNAGASVMGSYLYPRNGIITLDYEYILIFKKLGIPPEINDEIKEESKLTKEEWNKYFYGHWNFPGAKKDIDNHIAPFPEELPKRLIKMFSFKNETVFDPFLGSGTTSLAALKLERNSIGYEINREYKDIIYEKVNSGITIDCDGNVNLYNDDESLNISREYEENKLIYKNLNNSEKD